MVAGGGRTALSALLLLTLPLGPGPSAADAPARVAVFDLELVDSSLQFEIEGASPADLARLALITDELRRQLAASEAYRPVDLAPAAAAIEAAGSLRRCNGCEITIAQELGAEIALIGWVQKISNLILNINVQMRDVASGELTFGSSVDIRGNTDEAWLHGIRYLLRNRLLKE